MSIQITNLNFSYPSASANLFEDFSIQITDGWTCVAGSNGCGKSTLLKLVAGILQADGGKISIGDKGLGDVVYCPQETEEVPENLYSAFWSDDNEARKFFSILCISEEMLERYESLSGGEKKRIQIASALAERPSVLLLDEPTNHLDLKSSGMILSALINFTGTGIIVSHDRTFADSLCNRTVYLYRESEAFAGGRDLIAFDSYPCGLTKTLELRKDAGQKSRSDWERLNSKASLEKERSAKLEAQNKMSKNRLSKKSIDSHDHDSQSKIDAARISGKDRSTGDAKAHLESQIQKTESERDGIKKALQRKEGFSLNGSDFSKPLVVDQIVLQAGSYSLKIPHIEIKRGSKIALTGENGAGKSLFVKHLMSLLEKYGRQKEVLYLPQEIPDEQKDSIFAELFSLEENERGQVLSTLYRLGSEPERLTELKNPQEENDALPSLSPGELRKLMLALAVQKPLSLLILDEPTNHMDITSVVALEDALSSLDCAMIVVSHDKAFLQKICKSNLEAVRNKNQGEIKLL
ncbi:MAG: ATP-binding cassette domain-containing protein [Treponema sp.]|nr:ATP-binding cassette domain-containing protein [Treponema sp.]